VSLLPTKRPRPAEKRGIGIFRSHADPHDPSSAIALDLKDSLSDQPGLRLEGGNSRRRFFGGQLTPQRFGRPPASTNDGDAVRAATVQVHSRGKRGQRVVVDVDVPVAEVTE
jgi:hypothetical protein